MQVESNSQGAGKAGRHRQKAAVVVLTGLALLAFGGLAAAVSPSTGTPSSTGTCVPPGYTSPDSLLIPNSEPGGGRTTLSPGETLGAQIEMQIPHFQNSERGTLVQFPSVDAVLLLQGGSSVTLVFPPGSDWVNSSGWTSPISHQATEKMWGNFSTTASKLTTNWMAVMASTTYGSFQLEFQWRWYVVPSGSTHVQYGGWSHQSSTSSTTSQPTAFYPAPLVLWSARAAATQPANASYWVNLTGNVSGTSFRFVVETPNGHEVESICSATPSGASSYNATAPLQYSNGTALPAGPYLVHIHNAGGAIVYFAKVSVT